MMEEHNSQVGDYSLQAFKVNKQGFNNRMESFPSEVGSTKTQRCHDGTLVTLPHGMPKVQGSIPVMTEGVFQPIV